MNKLHKYPFSALYDISSGISTSKDQAGHGNPFVSFKTVFNNYFLPDELSDLMDSSLNDQVKYSVKKGDILVTRTSETVDELALSCVALKDYPKATFSGFLKRLRPKKSGIVYEKYIAFFLRSKYFRKVIDCNTIMTLRASFNEDIFSFLDLYLPEYKEQVTIGDLLYLIEHKIQINNKINDNLHQQLKLLFDYWFVQFDFPDDNEKPFKTSGGKMEWNEFLKRNVPKNFSVISMSQILSFLSGFSFSSEEFKSNAKYKLLTIKNVQDTGIISEVDNYIESIPTNMPDYCLLKPKDILMSLTGNVGRVGLLYFSNCLLNQRVALVKPNNSKILAYVYMLLKSDYIRKKFETIASGSSQANLSPIEASNTYIAYNNSLAEKFSSKVDPLINQIVTNLQENLALTELRNWLLPMLMNGQATIAE